MSIGLVLEGGAMRGMYTAGVLDMFLEQQIKVDGIIGVSAGVLFGVNYVSGQKGRTIRYNKKYAKDPRYMGMKSFLLTGNIINKDFAYYELPNKLDVFDEQAFEQNYIDFWATVTNVETGKPEYVKLEKPFEQMELLRATSAMPLVSKIVDWNNQKYLDGGISDSIPVEKCKQLGYDKIIVVLTRTEDYRKTKPNMTLAKIKYKKYPNLIKAMETRYQNYNQTLEKITQMEKNKEIFVIRPSRDLKLKRIERDTEKLQAMYDLGVNDTKKCLEQLKQYIEMK